MQVGAEEATNLQHAVRQLRAWAAACSGFGGTLPTPRGAVSESKAGFSHGTIPRNSLMQPRSTGNSAIPRLRSPPSAEKRSAAATRPSQVPVLPMPPLASTILPLRQHWHFKTCIVWKGIEADRI